MVNHSLEQTSVVHQPAAQVVSQLQVRDNVMKSRTLGLVFGTLLLLSNSVRAQAPGSGGSSDPWVLVGLRAGYRDGAGIEAYGMLSDFAQGFPLAVRLGISRTAVQPGSAWDARRIFINNNTNGDPEKKGRSWDVKLDFLVSASLFALPRTYVYGGVRHASFTGNFRFVGGNEDFDVTSSQWGLGAGLESYFAVSSRVDFVINGGLDHFFAGTLSGHDTSYSPDGEDINPREDYTYSDADAAIAQPKWEPVLMFGLAYRF